MWNRSSALTPREIAAFNTLYSNAVQDGLRELEPALEGLDQEQREQLVLTLITEITKSLDTVLEKFKHSLPNR